MQWRAPGAERAILLDEGFDPVGLSDVTLAFLLQTGASVVAIALLVALAAWAKIARPTPPLDEAAVVDLLAFEFPDAPIDAVWFAADRRGAIVRSASQALLIYRAGDGYVTRSMPWSDAVSAAPEDGALAFRLADVGAPRASFVIGDGAAWPPALEAVA